MINGLIKISAASLATALMAGCAHTTHSDYAKFRSEDPHSILVVPVVNRSVDVTAPDYFLSSISIPLVERGYYVFPVNLVKQVMADDGMSDSDMVHSQDPIRLAGLFDADSVMYISINRWEAKYAVLTTVVTVELDYALKSGKSGETLWKNHQILTYSPDNGGGSGIAGLIAAAINAAITKAAPNYMPLARQANQQALYAKGNGLPAGPYDGLYQKDKDAF
jgi:hypothetical protein